MSAMPRTVPDFTPAEIQVYYAIRASRIRQKGGEWRGPCPLHQGTRDSFAVNPETGLWTCHSQCGRGGSIFDFEMTVSGMDFKRAAAEVYALIGRANGGHRDGELGRVVAEYNYSDESGNLLFQCVRFDPKDFRQRQPDGRGGWVWNLKGVRLVLYRLPKVKDAEVVMVAEGEKDVHTLEALGFTATCNPMGAGKWRDEYSEFLRGKDVAIFPDNDAPGRKHAERVARSLAGKARSVKVVPVPTGKDLSDWVAAGATRESIEAAIRDAVTFSVERPAVVELPRVKSPDLVTGYDPEDVGNAQRLIAQHGDRLRYSHAFQKWLAWDGCRWPIDDADMVRTLAQQTMKEFARQAVEANNEALTKFAAQCRKSARISNAIREAQPHLAITPAELDTHPYLLNFRNVTVDLRTGEQLPHNPAQFITKMVRCDYNPKAECPTFMAFLARIMGVQPDATEGQLDRAQRLMAYLQKAFGYSLTGITSEKVVFLLHGHGDNGKSTLLSTFLKLLEEYAVLLQIDTLMVRQESTNTQADLADLRGARFVMTSETEEGQRLAEGKLKRITQGMGRIKATRKYENPIEFDESHKLWIDANHLPVVRGTDSAIWNRLHPIPFEVTIPKAEQDRQLPQKLMAEAEGILAWAVQGAMRWYREGLGKPPEVEQAGAVWRAESDQTGRFIEACCVTGSFARVPARALYVAYRKWADEGGERVETETSFGKRICEQGFSRCRREQGNVYEGIGLRTPAVGSV